MFNLFARVRFLSVTIFAAALMLTVKVGYILSGVDGALNGSIAVSMAKAQLDVAAPVNPSPANPKAAPASAEKKSPQNTAAASFADDDPSLLTQTEIELLQKLAERREQLDQRENEIKQRLGLLNAAELRIDKKVVELKKFQETIAKLVKTYDEQQNAKISSLVKIYEAMKPKDAALIFQELEMDTLLQVVERMNERKLAPIMSKMDPLRATEITVELSRLRNLPKPGASDGG